MKNAHLLEEEIQAIVFEQKDFSDFNEHVQHCTRCKNSIEAYKLVFKDFEGLPQPMFDFQVQVPLRMDRQKTTRNPSYFPVLLLAVLGFVGLAFGVIGYLSKNRLEKLESTWLSNWLVICTATILLIGLLVDLALGNEKKIKALNRSILQH